MNNFSFYFNEGLHHILSIDAIDHQLFLLALCAMYLINQWKQLLVLITAFTIGHCITLALSVFNLIKINSNLVEFLIPCTIMIMAALNFKSTNKKVNAINYKYIVALIFGLIHGLGFANTIRFMLANDQSLGWSLLSFNLGLEAGQIVVVTTILFISYLVVNKLRLKQQWWVYLLSTMALIWALKFAVERF